MIECDTYLDFISMEKLPAIGYTKQDNENFKSILGEKAPVGTQIENGFCFEFEIWTNM